MNWQTFRPMTALVAASRRPLPIRRRLPLVLFGGRQRLRLLHGACVDRIHQDGPAWLGRIVRVHLDAHLPARLHRQQGECRAFGDIELPGLAQAAMLVMYLVEGHISSLGASWMPPASIGPSFSAPPRVTLVP